MEPDGRWPAPGGIEGDGPRTVDLRGFGETDLVVAGATLDQRVDGSAEDDKKRTIRIEADRDECPSVFLAEGRGVAALAGRGEFFERRQVDGAKRLDFQRQPGNLAITFDQLSGYDGVILSDVPAHQLGDPLMNALRDYVDKLGGGLVMLGGPGSFGVGGYYRTPIEEVLPVRLKAPDEEEKQSAAVAIVLDRSGSMAGEKLEMAKSAAIATAEVLGHNDSLGVWAFDSEAHVVAPMTRLTSTNAVSGQIAAEIGRDPHLVQTILQERKLAGTASITINNKPGGGGAIAYTYLQAHPGNGHFVSIASKSLLTNHISGRAPLTYTHLTPLAILFDEYIAVAVKADSPIKSGREILDRMKKDPGSLSFGVATSLGNPNHQGIAMALKDAGIDLRKTKTPVFQSGGNAITALLGGHVDAVPGSVGLMRKYVEAGTVRLVAIASPQRLGGIFANTPTWKEQGADAVVSNWRGFVGAPNLTPAQIAYWDGVFGKIAVSPEFKEQADKNQWEISYKNSAETAKFFASEYSDLKSVMDFLGLSGKPNS
mgnify:CR=1 FL=1